MISEKNILKLTIEVFFNYCCPGTRLSMTKKRTDNRLRVRYPVTPKSSKSKTSNAERCKAYRDKLKQDPLLIPKIRAKDIERARRNRKRPKSKDLIEHERQLNKERQKRYRLDINCGRGKIHLCAVCLLQFCMFINH